MGQKLRDFSHIPARGEMIFGGPLSHFSGSFYSTNRDHHKPLRITTSQSCNEKLSEILALAKQELPRVLYDARGHRFQCGTSKFRKLNDLPEHNAHSVKRLRHFSKDHVSIQFSVFAEQSCSEGSSSSEGSSEGCRGALCSPACSAAALGSTAARCRACSKAHCSPACCSAFGSSDSRETELACNPDLSQTADFSRK